MSQAASEPQGQQQQSTQPEPPAPTQTEQPAARTPDDLFKMIDGVTDTINALPDRIVEAMKQAGGVTKAQEDAARQAATGARTGTQPAQVDQKAGHKSFAEWWTTK